MQSLSLGLSEALRLTLAGMPPLAAVELPLLEALSQAAAGDHQALVDSPARDASRKDGYAVASHELATAAPGNPARLRVLGSLAAGGVEEIALRPGAAVRVLTGARLPAGADAVVAEEYTRREGDQVLIDAPVAPGFNLLPRGGDARAGRVVLTAGQVLTPLRAGLLAAAGHATARVHAAPRVGVLGTGDELALPGQPLSEGQLHASNIVTLAALCRQFGLSTRLAIARDEAPALAAALTDLLAQSDALVTSGGAWQGDRDLMVKVLEGLGWEKVFHRIRIGPGKAVGFGRLEGRPVFILPGGPPSNLMGFLQIALPGLLALAGRADPGLPRVNARLGADIGEGKVGWTDFFYGRLEPGPDLPIFYPQKKRTRLMDIAQAEAVAAIPEGRESLAAGEVVSVQLLP